MVLFVEVWTLYDIDAFHMRYGEKELPDIIVGGILQARGSMGDAATLLGAAAILLATINIAGGFLVTERMLRMFRK